MQAQMQAQGRSFKLTEGTIVRVSGGTGKVNGDFVADSSGGLSGPTSFYHWGSWGSHGPGWYIYAGCIAGSCSYFYTPSEKSDLLPTAGWIPFSEEYGGYKPPAGPVPTVAVLGLLMPVSDNMRVQVAAPSTATAHTLAHQTGGSDAVTCIFIITIAPGNK